MGATWGSEGRGAEATRIGSAASSFAANILSAAVSARSIRLVVSGSFGCPCVHAYPATKSLGHGFPPGSSQKGPPPVRAREGLARLALRTRRHPRRRRYRRPVDQVCSGGGRPPPSPLWSRAASPPATRSTRRERSPEPTTTWCPPFPRARWRAAPSETVSMSAQRRSMARWGHLAPPERWSISSGYHPGFTIEVACTRSPTRRRHPTPSRRFCSPEPAPPRDDEPDATRAPRLRGPRPGRGLY